MNTYLNNRLFHLRETGEFVYLCGKTTKTLNNDKEDGIMIRNYRNPAWEYPNVCDACLLILLEKELNE